MPILGSIVITALIYRYENFFSYPDLGSYVLFFTVSTICIAFALVPSTYLAVASGFLLGWISIPLVIVSYLSAALIARFLFANQPEDFIPQLAQKRPQLNTYLTRLRDKPFALVFYGRISVLMPFSVMNVVFAILKIDLKSYLLGSVVGMFPRTLISIAIGMQSGSLLESIKGGEFVWWKFAILAGLLLFSFVGFGWILKSKGKEQSGNVD